jgi:HEAT repeat protein
MRAVSASLLFVVALCTSASGYYEPVVPAKKPEPKYEGKPLAYWVEKFQKAEKDEERSAAENAICAFGVDGAEAVPTLLAMLHDRSPSYRARVVRMLSEIGPGAKEAVPELLKRIKEMHADKIRAGEEYKNRYEIADLIEILGAIGPNARESIPTLSSLLGDADFQSYVIQALCKIGPDAKTAIPAIRRALLETLAKRPQPSYSISNLYKLGPDVAPLLFDLLCVPDLSLQDQAFRQLTTLDRGTLKGSAQLAKLLTADNDVVRFYAALLAWETEKNPEAISVLAALLVSKKVLCEREIAYTVDYVAWHSIGVLGNIGPEAKEAVPALQRIAAMGFIVWWFSTSHYERPGETRPFYLYDRVALGTAAQGAIDKITAQPETKK